MKRLNHLTRLTVITLSSVLLLSACSQSDSESKNTNTEGNQTPDKKFEPIAPSVVIGNEDIDRAAKAIDETGFMQHVNILASDEYEGRAPSTPGGKKTVEYLEAQYQQLGLKPAFGNSYRQAVELNEITVTNSPALSIEYKSGESHSLAYKEKSIVFTSRATETSSIQDSQLVFVGYGVVAPEYGWDDYQGIDMNGKTAVILVNDPGFRNPDGGLFGGRAMTYYGRWTYKFEEAARQGAAGAIVIHEDQAAGYPWEVVSGSWSGAQYSLYTSDGNAGNLAVESWMTQGSAEHMFTTLGLNFGKLVEQAGSNRFRAIPLDANASTSLQLTSKKSQSYNVGGYIEGRGRPDEIFIYTAHWDHIGLKPDDTKEDVIYNGAQDNATGTAALLEMAQAYQALPAAPARSVMFLAVTAEESGLLGSKHYSEQPAFAMNKTVAGINMDGMATYGETDDIVVVGYGNSQMDDYLRAVSTTQGREVVPEPTPEKGYFYRSDHFNLAKKGVPMLYAESGIKARGKPEGWGEEAANGYLKDRYHKPADEVHAAWDNGGILQDMNAHFRIGMAISNSNDWPKWTEGNEFRAIREASMPQ